MTVRPRYPRSSCCIPFCRRWSTLFRVEWMCGRHYRLVDRALKRYRTTRWRALDAEFDEAKRALQVAQEAFRGGVGRELDVWRTLDRLERVRARWDRSVDLIWRRMKRQATERSVGLA